MSKNSNSTNDGNKDVVKNKSNKKAKETNINPPKPKTVVIIPPSDALSVITACAFRCYMRDDRLIMKSGSPNQGVKVDNTQSVFSFLTSLRKEFIAVESPIALTIHDNKFSVQRGTGDTLPFLSHRGLRFPNNPNCFENSPRCRTALYYDAIRQLSNFKIGESRNTFRKVATNSDAFIANLSDASNWSNALKTYVENTATSNNQVGHFALFADPIESLLSLISNTTNGVGEIPFTEIAKNNTQIMLFLEPIYANTKQHVKDETKAVDDITFILFYAQSFLGSGIRPHVFLHKNSTKTSVSCVFINTW